MVDGSMRGSRLIAVEHWFTTYLRRAGMPREYIKYLRGDSLNETMDIYNHIDFEELKESYDRCIPKLLV